MTAPARILCAHAGDGQPMHWLEPGETCTRPLTTAPDDTDLMGAGRSQPRPAPVPDGFRHDLRFYGGTDSAGRAIAGLRVTCQPCAWSRHLDNHHDLADLINLLAQHAGLDAAKKLCIDTLAKYGAEHDQPAPLTLVPLEQCRACHAVGTELIKLTVLVNGIEEDGPSYCRDLIACADRIKDRAAVST